MWWMSIVVAKTQISLKMIFMLWEITHKVSGIHRNCATKENQRFRQEWNSYDVRIKA